MKDPNPGTGYRLLKDGEIISTTDQSFLCGTGPWGYVHKWNASKVFSREDFYPIRRKEPNGWNVTFKTRKAARLAAAMSFKEDVLKGPNKA